MFSSNKTIGKNGVSDMHENKTLEAGFLDDYSIKDQELDVSIDSGESEFPNESESMHIKLIYEKRKFIECPNSISKHVKFFYQHDLDRLTLSDKFTKAIFEKA